MRSVLRTSRAWTFAVLAALLLLPSAAPAQWSQVADIPSRDVFTVWANGDTLVAGADTVVYISTNAGTTWKRSVPVAPGIQQVHTSLIHDGRLYAGTDVQGVFVSDDLGSSWSSYNQGLSGLGSLDIAELIVEGGNLYLATIGGGPWVRSLSSASWTRFGTTITALQASNMTSIAAGGSRLFALGGFNGTVFYRDPGQSDWTLSLLFNDRFAPGLAGLSAIWTGRNWVVGSNIGIFHSANGAEPWTDVDFGFHPILFVGFAMRGHDLFTSLGAGGGTLIALSRDDGVTWNGLDSLFNAFVYKLARVGDSLYAGRVDGLWRRSIANIALPGDDDHSRLVFATVGRAARDRARFVFTLPEGGVITIEVFDVRGRRVGDVIRDTRPSGKGEIGWDASQLASGIYYARLTSMGRRASTRLVHLR
jgi:hypothetical protein